MKKFVLLGLLMSVSVSAFADIRSFTEVPSSWKLEDYINGAVVAWNTSSSCNNGVVSLSSGSTPDVKNRFWSTVSTAKVTGKKVFVRYESNGAHCIIQSFGLAAD